MTNIRTNRSDSHWGRSIGAFRWKYSSHTASIRLAAGDAYINEKKEHPKAPLLVMTSAISVASNYLLPDPEDIRRDDQ
jgi:hypothetical protein